MPSDLHEDIKVLLHHRIAKKYGYKGLDEFKGFTDYRPDVLLTKPNHRPIGVEVERNGSKIPEKITKCRRANLVPLIINYGGYNYKTLKLKDLITDLEELFKECIEKNDPVIGPRKKRPDDKKFSTTIKRKYWEQKMEQVKEQGYFYEYKQDSRFWRKRFNKLIIPCDGVFLVGSEPHEVRVIEVIRRLTSEFFDVPPPEILTERTWRLTCVPKETG